jgi:heme exporter protein C
VPDVERSRVDLASWMTGAAAVALLVATAFLGFVVTGPDVVLGESVRLLYIHAPIAWVAYLAFIVAAVTGLLWLWPRTRHPRWDHLTGASVEIGVVCTGLTLLLGSFWGRPTWGVWWTWDARVTTTLILFLVYLGVTTVRRLPADVETRARRTAVAAVLAVAQVPIVHMSVRWWKTLHQAPSVLKPDILDPEIVGVQLVTLLLGFVAFTLTYVWLLIRRARLERWRDELADGGLDAALRARRAEASGRSTAAPTAPAAAGTRVLEGGRP